MHWLISRDDNACWDISNYSHDKNNCIYDSYWNNDIKWITINISIWNQQVIRCLTYKWSCVVDISVGWWCSSVVVKILFRCQSYATKHYGWVVTHFFIIILTLFDCLPFLATLHSFSFRAFVLSFPFFSFSIYIRLLRCITFIGKNRYSELI